MEDAGPDVVDGELSLCPGELVLQPLAHLQTAVLLVQASKLVFSSYGMSQAALQVGELLA